ncbi:MAG: hypothetical protein ACI89X_000673 [Planctomycetota bacterium]|jgi:hypothetical protein
MRALHILSASLVLSSFAATQCAFSSVSVSSYGQPCSVFSTNPTTVGVQLDVTNCELGIDVSAFPGCCNTYLVGRVLVLGLQPITQPLPQLGCTLLTSPDVVLFQTTGSTFPLQMPSAPFPATTLFAQGAAIYFTTIGFSVDWAFSSGAQINLQ